MSTVRRSESLTEPHSEVHLPHGVPLESEESQVDRSGFPGHPASLPRARALLPSTLPLGPRLSSSAQKALLHLGRVRF